MAKEENFRAMPDIFSTSTQSIAKHELIQGIPGTSGPAIGHGAGRKATLQELDSTSQFPRL